MPYIKLATAGIQIATAIAAALMAAGLIPSSPEIVAGLIAVEKAVTGTDRTKDIARGGVQPGPKKLP